MDLYLVLGVRREASAGGHPARLQAPRTPIPSRHQPGRSARRRRVSATSCRPTRRWSIPSGAGATTTASRRWRHRARPASPASISRRASIAERTTTFGDLFGGAFVPVGAGGRPARGADLHTTVVVPLADDARAEPPDAHAGAAMSAAARAPATGTTQARRPTTAWRARARAASASCAGTCCSRRRAVAVAAAAGSRPGAARRATAAASSRAPSRLTIDVPAGVADGAVIRLSGLGHAGRGGGPPGDLHVAVAHRAAPAVPP